MIKFFRKFRHDILMRKETLQYFKYALGEIILVVIGTLLALQINEWNTQVKDKRISKLYYQKLLADVEADIAELKKRIDYSKNVNSALNILIFSLKNNTYSTANQDTLEYAIHTYYRVSGWEFSLNTYKEMESSGNLRYIQNDGIRTAITKYVNAIESTKIVRERYTEDIIEKTFYIDEYVFFNPRTDNGITYDIDYEGLSKNNHIINLLSRIAMRWDNNYGSFVSIRDLAIQIRESIVEELKLPN